LHISRLKICKIPVQHFRRRAEEITLGFEAEQICHQIALESGAILFFPFAFIFLVWNHIQDKMVGLKIALTKNL
jgi:hypothetical protein